MRSSIAIEQREKEGKTLRSFLTYSLIGSLALHMGVLSLTANDWWNRAEIAEEPIEIAIIDPPKRPTPEPEQKPEPPVKNVITKTPVAPPEPEPVAPAPLQAATVVAAPKPVAVQKQVAIKPEPAPQPKPVENLKPAPQPKPVQKLAVATQQVAPTPAPNPQLAQQLRSLRDLRSSQIPVATNPTPITKPNTTASALRQSLSQTTTAARNSTTTGTVSNTPTTNSTTASNPPKSYRPATPAPRGSNIATSSGVVKPSAAPTSNQGGANSSSSGRFGCRNCTKPKYPEKARRRGIEGRAEISVDVDGKGNVTNVRVARSTGNRELDEAAVREARRWKFDAPKGGRQGVVAKVDFAIEGSPRSRELRENRRQRQASRKKRSTATANATPTRRIRRIQQSPAAQTARIRTNKTATVPRRRLETLPPRRAQDVPVRQRRTVQATPRQTQLQRSLRRQKPQSQQAAPSRHSLRNTLRRSRQQTPSTPTNSSSGSAE